MLLGRWGGDWVKGEFEVTSTAVVDLSEGSRTARISGRLVEGDTHGAIVTTTRTRDAAEPLPEPGTRVPARWRRNKPAVHRIDWREDIWATMARRERDRRAAALGLDPATVDTHTVVPDGVTAREACLYWSTSAAPLPDGTDPVQVAEAQRLVRYGEPADGVVLAVDMLRPWPGTAPDRHASIANVAVQVTRRDGTSYRALARFGFRTEQRRRQIGRVGAAVPVRLDPARPERIALDSSRLPPISTAR